MKLPPGMEKAIARFDRLSVRERALVLGAALVATGMLWMMAVLDPMTAQARALADELASLQASLDPATAAVDVESNATTARLEKEKKLQESLDELNAKLASASHGLIPPERMVQVIRDVLDDQRGITLVMLHNKPVVSLLAPAKNDPVEPAAQKIDPESGEVVTEATPTEGAASAEAAEQPDTGPYMHPVEIVIQGSYLDVLAYLHALEALPWHFYWQVLELKSTDYPTNVVRIELGTLSMDKEWLGV